MLLKEMINLEENSAPDKNKKMMILIIGLLVALIGVVIGVAFFIISSLNSDDTGVEVAPIHSNVLTPADITLIPIGAPIVTNLIPGVDGRERMVSLSFSVAVNHREEDSDDGAAELIALLDRTEAVVRSIGLDVVRERTFEELRSREAAALLSAQILTRIQDEFQTNLIVNIVIDDLRAQ